MTPATLTYPEPRLSWLTGALEILLPKECLVCSRPLRGRTLCVRCRPQLPDLDTTRNAKCPLCFEPTSAIESICPACELFPLPADSIRFMWVYSGLARDLIRSMKYRPSMRLARLGGCLLAQAIPHLFADPHWNLIVPVPSSARTYRKRLFHPCVEIAHEISRVLSLPVRPLLIHDRRRAPQAQLHHDARLRNLGALFTARKDPTLVGARVLLVEDVITTGATIAAATSCLKEAGASSVDVCALARAQSWGRFRERVWRVFNWTNSYGGATLRS